MVLDIEWESVSLSCICTKRIFTQIRTIDTANRNYSSYVEPVTSSS